MNYSKEEWSFIELKLVVLNFLISLCDTIYCYLPPLHRDLLCTHSFMMQ